MGHLLPLFLILIFATYDQLKKPFPHGLILTMLTMWTRIIASHLLCLLVLREKCSSSLFWYIWIFL